MTLPHLNRYTIRKSAKTAQAQCGQRQTIIRLLGISAITLAALTGCASSDKYDETRGWSAEKLYAEAKESLDAGDYAKAVKTLETLEVRYPFGVLAQQAQLSSAYAQYKENETASALASIDRFIQLHPSHEAVDYAYYLKGLINFNDNLGFLGRFSGQDMSERDPKAARAAYESYKTLITRFPNSRYAEDARLRMQFIINTMAQSEVNAARFYLKRGAFLAAVNRAQQAVKEYDRAPATEEALAIMIKAYAALGLNELKQDSERVLRSNFPQSHFLSENAHLGGKSNWWKFW
jgi:outer membrane protein assembly factor BamD